MNAYDESYLERAQITLGSMLDYAVHDLQMDLGAFYMLFLTTGLADRFADGCAACTVGNSGAELALKVLEKAGLPWEPTEPRYREGRSKEFWTGWALAYYQWSESESFKRIQEFMPVDQIRDMYEPYHEMDLRQFADTLKARKNAYGSKTALARLRRYAELSQSMLAEKSGVPVRTIQQYEQRQKHIEKAGADQLARLSRALCCSAEVLIR